MENKEKNVVIKIDGVSKVYPVENGDDVVALKDVNLEIYKNEFICVVGPSGCGKTTLLNIIGGLEQPTGGEATIHGRPILGPGPDRGIIFQQYALFPWLTVKKNVLYATKFIKHEVPLMKKNKETGEIEQVYEVDEQGNKVPVMKRVKYSKYEREAIANKYINMVQLTQFANKYPNNKNDLIAYFSAEYGLDQTMPIYSGGLGILSGDHLKSASDLGIPLVAVGLLYKNGYFNQKINGAGGQETEYKDIDLYNLPIHPAKDENGEDLIMYVKFPKRRLYLKVWQVNVGRVKLYLLDSDIDKNNPEDRNVTLRLYGGDQEMRIRQEIVLGQAGVELLTRYLKLEPTVYHMNEGHSAFLTLEIIKNIIKEKQVIYSH